MPNMPAIPLIKKEQILELMEYRDGEGLFWKVHRGRFASPGLKVGGSGRSQVRLAGVRVYVHHIVWFLHHGYWPSEKGLWIDHRDGDHTNEEINNLREASPSQNNQNRSVSRSRELPKGVSKSEGKFSAILNKDGERFFLGRYHTIQEAAAAYEGASRVLHGEFSFFCRNELSDKSPDAMVISEPGERS